MLCHKCPHQGKYVGVKWSKTPCSRCRMNKGTSHTAEYDEGVNDQDDVEADLRQPFDGLMGNDEEPTMPLSVLAKAMACWISMTLPAREIFCLRMEKKSLAEIGKVLGISRVAVFNTMERAIKDNPVLASLDCRSKVHRFGPKFEKERNTP